MMHLEVAVAVPLRSTLTYLYVDDTYPENNLERKERDETYVGRRVLVPLSGRIVTGYVVACQPFSQLEFRIKEVHRFVGERPFFSPEIVPFFRWVAEYYQHPIGEVISTALPAGLKQSSQKIIQLGQKEISSANLHELDGDIPQWLQNLQEKAKLGVAESREILGNRKWNSLVQKLVAAGYISIASDLSSSLTGAKKEICYLSEHSIVYGSDDDREEQEKITALQDVMAETLGTKFKFSEAKAFYFYQQLAQKSDISVPQKDILALYKSGRKPLKVLSEKGVLLKQEERIYRNPIGEVPTFYPKPAKLSTEQQDVLAPITTQLGKNVFTPFLLHGVTGSGKTEIYLRAAEKCLQNGMGVLVLVPEIALATQLEAHFVSRFGKTIAILHSGLSKGERYDQWTLVAKGEARLVIGARSAVFAPLKNIGLIIVDEEHDSGFKQQDGLKYNGRDLAVLRAKMFNCVVILGSATPSVTSYHHALSSKYTLLKMASRLGEGGFPQVTIIDLNSERKKESQKSPFHPAFLAELGKNLENREQSLVLLNRRGFSASYLCQDCGLAVQCQHCNVTLTYHKHREQLICHYCGYKVVSNLVCGNCHGEKLVPYGVGTERVEEELCSHFPEAVIERLDSDTAGDRKKFLAILRAMRNREIDILIGTQMIAKGHHFPYVTFVGVVWADGGLNMPDFRAAERTYQLLSQVTGRAGRDELQGRVIIQTMLPDHYAIALATQHDYTAFYQQEISLRKKPAFPPFIRLACLRISGQNEFNVRKTSTNIAISCRKLQENEDFYLNVLGPAPSPLGKIKDKYRWQILFKADRVATLHSVWKHVMENSKQLVLGRSECRFDLDPENMM